MDDDRLLNTVRAVMAHSHIAQAKAMRDRAETRKLGRAAADVIWFQIHAHEAAAHELVEAALKD